MSTTSAIGVLQLGEAERSSWKRFVEYLHDPRCKVKTNKDGFKSNLAFTGIEVIFVIFTFGLIIHYTLYSQNDL